MRVKSGVVYCNDKIEKLNSLEFIKTEREGGLLNVYPVKKAKILGFGGAFTESSAYNYSHLSPKEKQAALEYLFGESGLKYNFCRLCIGSSDFALDEYCYVEDNDTELKTFSIERDKKYIIPFIKDAISYAKREITFFASPWSPPAFMKENKSRIHGGRLREEYYSVYAEYIARFLTEYRKEGINVSSITIQNEPKASQTWESCFFSVEDEIEFSKILKKVLIEKDLNVKLFCWDHNKERLFERADRIFSECGDIFDGAAFHWYSGNHFGAIDALKAKYKDKTVIETEFCKSIVEDRVEKSYADEILNNLKHGTNVICDWNMILDGKGGPYHNRYDGCDAVLQMGCKDYGVIRKGIYYETYMFSHFIETGAYTLYTSSFDDAVKVNACENPNGEIVVNILNDGNDCNVMLYICGKGVEIDLKSGALYTFIVEKETN